MDKRPPPLAHVLPPDAEKILQQAAQTPVHAGNPIPRRAAIDRAVAQVKQQYPQFFRKEGER